MNASSASRTDARQRASSRETTDPDEGPSAAFYFFVGALALSLLTLIAFLVFM